MLRGNVTYLENKKELCNMLLVTSAIVILILYIVLRYLPLKQINLIEGVFDRREEGFDFYEKVIAFWFDNKCRECIEKNVENGSLYNQCYATIPATAINLDSVIEPQNGDSIKIVAWKTFFGRVVMYRFVRTNFADEFVLPQLRQEKDEWEAYCYTSECRKAMKLGISLEEYRKARKEEEIQYVSERLGLSPEEAVEHEYDKLPRSVLYIVKKLTEELGRKPTRDEIWVKERKDLDDLKKCMMSISLEESDNPECLAFRYGNLCDEYIVTGVAPNREFSRHLAECSECLSHIMESRERFLNSKSLNCLTADECDTIRISGFGPRDRKDHIGTCYHCLTLFRKCEKEHLSGQLGSECLTKDTLHTIHTTGDIPEVSKEHMKNCLRCQKAAEKHKDIYMDAIIPLPKLPKTRFKSIRDNYKDRMTT